MSGRAIRSIVVAGGGIVGLSAALAFRRSLPQAEVTIIDLPVDAAALADRVPIAWPSIGAFHALIGLDERNLVRRGVATHHAGTVYDWSGRRKWVHSFGPHGKPVGTVHFDQIWVRAQAIGQARPYDDYALGSVLARAGKFVYPDQDPSSPASRFAYGLKLCPEAYRENLRGLAHTVGIRTTDASVRSVERGDTGLSGVLLDSGRIEADLFVDCTGPAGQLIREVTDEFEDWPLPIGLLSIEETAPQASRPAVEVTGAASGWTAEWQLRDRTLRCVAGKGDINIRPGRRVKPWTGNVLALGDAATAIDPLNGLNLTLAHRMILLALELLPGKDMNPLELAEYNRRSGLITDQVRDFIALHYGAELPGDLRRRLDQYEHRGRILFQEDEILNRDDWTSALIGLGHLPTHADPVTEVIPLERAVGAMEKLATDFAKLAAQAPAYPDYLARMISPSSAAI